MKPDYELKPAMKKMHIQSLRKEQIKPIQSILKEQDTIVSAPTSMGKSLIYQLPALVHGYQLTLVIEPTLALIYDQVKKLQAFGISAIAIGNPLKLSPDFPPLCTVHAAFTAHGVPSEMNFNGFEHNLHTSLQHFKE